MRRPADFALIKKSLEVRRLQERGAHMESARAISALGSAMAAEDDRQEQLQQEQDDWTRCLSEPTVSLSIVGAWSAQISRSETALNEATLKTAEAEEERDSRLDEWRGALAKADAAGQLTRRAVVSLRRKREEAAQAELSDRISGRGVVA